MVNYLNNLASFIQKEYIFALFLLNVIIYLLLLFILFSIFFIFDVKYIKTLNELKFLGKIRGFSILMVLLLMGFAGIPPLLGFASKMLIFLTLIHQSDWPLLIFFTLINLFLIYFYIQNFRFLVPKKIYEKNIFKGNFSKSPEFIYISAYFNFCNFFGIVYAQDLYVYLMSVTSGLCI